MSDAAARFDEAFSALAGIGASGSGGYERFAWTEADAQLRAWFCAEAGRRAMPVETDRNGNLWAWWPAPGPGAVVTGSHLDSVPGGGAFDGPLGVVSAFLALDLLRERNGASGLAVPVAVACFSDEEGARFGTACVGSRLLTGALPAGRARALRDADGVSLAEALRAAGVDPDGIGPDGERLARLSAFVELHVEQGRALDRLGAPVGVASGIWPHGRWRASVRGEANHAGTTRLEDRHDPLLVVAGLVLDARAAAARHGALATVGKLAAEPGASNAVAALAEAWLDARAPGEERLEQMLDELRAVLELRAAEHEVELLVAEESRTPAIVFDEALRARVGASVAGVLGAAPELSTGAGHDAGVLASALPTAMLFVRNPTGASHTPAEHAERDDCLAGVEALAAVLHELTARGERLAVTGAAAGAPGERVRYWCEYAWLGGEVAAAGVAVEIAGDRFASVQPGPPPPGATRLSGLTLPGIANVHSHAFHRALRGASERGSGDFWSWRQQMYAVAAGLDPDRYLELATAVFSEMALSGYSAVGEFHYLHHAPGGRRYADPNVMGAALLEAASRAGVRITLLDACYLEGGPGVPLDGVQLRFGDGSAAAWCERMESLLARSSQEGGLEPCAAKLGAAIHSARAVPPGSMAEVAGFAASRGLVLHAHLSEQTAENEAVLAAFGVTPTELLHDAGALGPSSTVVHATHLEPDGVRLLGSSATSVCMCPTTERDLGDGIGVARELSRAGAPLCIGSDSHAVVDAFEELRALELDERLASRQRGRFSAGELLEAGCRAGQRALGWSEAGAIEPGRLADLVTVSLDSPRLAGHDPSTVLHQVLYGASPAEVSDVVVSGRRVVAGGRHVGIDVAAALQRAVTSLDRP